MVCLIGKGGTRPNRKAPPAAPDASVVVADKPQKAPKKVTADVYFKTLRTLLDNLAEITWLITALASQGDEGRPFAALLAGHHMKLSAAYEAMRVETTNTTMNTDSSTSSQTAISSGDLGPDRQDFARSFSCGCE